MSNENTIRADLWDIAVALYKTRIASPEEVMKWDRNEPRFVSHEMVGDKYVIGVENEFEVEYYSNDYSEPIRTALIMAGMPTSNTVQFVVNKEAAAAAKEKLREKEAAEKQLEEKVAVAEAEQKPAVKRSGFSSTIPLNENYTFENFVRGPSNSFAYAIAESIAKQPGGNTNNPYFVWGGTGLGKTHLMQAIGHYVMRHDPMKSVCYITSETFLNEYLNALANKAMEAFRQRYRNIDLLLLDDVQFIGGKMQFQEEFFNTYEGLMTYGKQVVMTCDVPPAKLNSFEERLITRFQQGITIEIESPSYETRVAILKSKARNSRVKIPDEIFNYIGENIHSSVRAMEGALNLVISFIEANPNMPFTQQVANALLKDLTEKEVTMRRLTVDEIIKEVCSTYDVSATEMLANNRTQPLATARQVAMFLARKLTGKSLDSVAEAFDRNHTTILHGSQSIQKRISIETGLKETLEKITERLGRKPSELFE